MANATRYTVVNTQGEFLEDDSLLLLAAWTPDIRRTWLTYSELEARRVAHQSEGQAVAVTFTPLPADGEAVTHRGLPIAVQKQVITLREQGMSYRHIARLLNISKSTVGNIVSRK
ncbi:sigma factor-like helix-turn-helix DNA-binding protein [Lacticaseibacillus kribbianus]|uniref:sigma factor-like helix-turn-helix DNA-binding protein n=1 Tax=Lacticaseibacillus kribbianus TaxID=2926292 RepID=UPI001CD7F0FC|nr:helix-turn-helix domain-containing protein [Lacticaseibacillus kribbianus]